MINLCTLLYWFNCISYFRDCKDCRMLTAGNYDKTQSYSLNSGKVSAVIIGNDYYRYSHKFTPRCVWLVIYVSFPAVFFLTTL